MKIQRETITKLVLPVVILLSCVALGAAVYFTQIEKQRSIERQQQLELEIKKEELEAKKEQDALLAEQRYYEMVAERKKECYEIGEREMENYSNYVSSEFKQDFWAGFGNDFSGDGGDCIVTYSTDQFDGVDCESEYPPHPEYGYYSDPYFQCVAGTFTKTF